MKLTKVVNIYPSMPITGVNPPIRSAVKRVTKSVEEIRICLMSRAVVEEILPNGKTVRLNISNYDKCSCSENKSVCGCGCCGNAKVESATEENKTPWQIAYDKAIAGKNLASMTRKQRRSAEAAARAAADAAVAISEPEVVMGVASIESAEEVKEAVQEVETLAVEDIEEEVETIDVEKISE